MKIAIVLNTSWNIYNFRMGLIGALQQAGHEIHTIAPEDEFSSKLTNTGCIFHKVRMDSRGANPIKDLALTAELFFLYRRIRPDIILHYTIKPNIYGTFAAALLGLPMINNVCGLGTVFLQKGLVSKVAKIMYKLAFRFPKKVFFQNSEDRDLFIQSNLIQDNLTDVIPGSGIDLEKFRPQGFQRNQQFTFLLISRLIKDKGIFEYIEAIKQLKKEGIDARFQLLGAKDPEHKRGIPVEVIDDWIEEELVEYMGTAHDVRPLIQQADCVVLPSYREGTPRTLLEAASMGKAIVATNVPGCRNVVKHQYNGLLCNLQDAADLAQKMANMQSLDEQQIQTFGKNGRDMMEQRFGESKVIEAYLGSIHEICA